MCGIAGYFEPSGRASRSQVEAMCDQIVYRGPDDAGYYVDGGCALGMRRLSIIDLAGGHQPISNEDGSVWVVFNGEIYNYKELRDLVAGRGHKLVTNSDTEVLVHLYEDEGTEGIARLRGMFAYAIWDARARRVMLARDRFGKKPLYYAVLPSGIYFGSELKCLATAGVPLELDRDALRYYFQFGYIPDPWSPFKAVRKLGAASWMTFDSSGNVQHGRYWKLPAPGSAVSAGFTEEAAREELRDLFDESVRLRMIADVPLGAFLSGGVDSSIIVASMARQSTEPVKTFSIGFKENGFNELEFAQVVARQYKTDHHEILVEPDSVSLVERLVRHFDEPFADSAAIPTLVMSEFAAQHVKVALSGDGGDELFGGYTSFFAVDGYLRKFDSVPGPVRSLLRWLGDALPYSAYGKNYLRVAWRSERDSALLRVQLPGLCAAARLASARLDAAGRQRIPHEDGRRLFSSRRNRCIGAGHVLGSNRQSYRRHAGQSGSDVDGSLARSALPAARSQTCRIRGTPAAFLDDSRRQGQSDPDRRVSRPLSRGVPGAQESRLRDSSGELVSRAATSFAGGLPGQPQVSGAWNRVTAVCTLSARRTLPWAPEQQLSIMDAADPGNVVPHGGSRNARANSGGRHGRLKHQQVWVTHRVEDLLSAHLQFG